MLARIGRYWGCFEEVEEYEIEVSKVKRIRKMKKPEKEKSEVGSTNNQEVNDEKDLDLSSMQKLKPGRVATMDKTLYAKNIVLDDTVDDALEVNVQQQINSSMSNLNMNMSVEGAEETQMEGFKAQLLKKKLQRIREKRREREAADGLGIGVQKRNKFAEKSHILNVHNNE